MKIKSPEKSKGTANMLVETAMDTPMGQKKVFQQSQLSQHGALPNIE